MFLTKGLEQVAARGLKIVLCLSVVGPARAISNHLQPPVAGSQQQKSLGALSKILEQNIALVLAQRLSLSPADFRVSVESLQTQPSLDFEPKGNLQILGASLTNLARVDGVISFPVLVQDKAGFKELHLTGVLKVIGPVVVANRNLKRGDVIASQDLSTVQMPWRQLPAGSAGLSLKSLVGLGVKTMVMAGAALSRDMVDEPLDIKMGDLVDITVHSGPGVMIRSRAVARQEGRKGDTIRLVQPETKKNIEGHITGPKSVEVQL